MLAIVVVSSCALWATPLLPRSSVDHRPLDSVETEHQAAQITLFVLRATVAGAASTREAFILPYQVSLSMNQAAGTLAIMRKPVRCTGILEDAVLAITCQPIREAEALEHYQRAAMHISTWQAEVKKRCQGPAGEARLLLRRRGSSMTVPFSALVAWLRGYDMDFSLGGDRTIKLPRGICMIVEVGLPGTMKIHTDAGPVRS